MEMRMKYNDLKYFGAKLATLILLLIGIAMELCIFEQFGPISFGGKILLSFLVVLILVGVNLLAIYTELLTEELLGETNTLALLLGLPIILSCLAMAQLVVVTLIGIWLLIISSLCR